MKLYRGKKILGIIPARGGSKELPRKNVLPLLGKPLIAWTVEQAKRSKYIDKVIVSTDDKEIAVISKKYGAEIPFFRPKELAEDDSKVIDAILLIIEWIKQNGMYYDLIILLQPTSPLRTPEDIDNSIKLLFSKNAQAVVSVCEVEHHPHLTNTLPEDGSMENFLVPEFANKNRQKLPVFYRLNGAVYLAYLDYLLAKKGFFGDGTYAYLMERKKSIDIDNDIDFKYVEFLLQNS